MAHAGLALERTAEPYWRGVGRRVRTIAILAAITSACSVLCYLTFEASGSARLTLVAGLVLGAASECLDPKADPLRSAMEVSRSDRLLWLALSAPALVLLIGLLLFFLVRPPADMALTGAVLAMQLLGFCVAATTRLLSSKAVRP